MINFAKRQVVVYGHLSALDHSTSILPYFQVEDGFIDQLTSLSNASLFSLRKNVGKSVTDSGYAYVMQ